MPCYTEYCKDIKEINLKAEADVIKQQCRDIKSLDNTKEFYTELKKLQKKKKNGDGIPIFFVDTELARVMEEAKEKKGYGELRVFISGENGIGKSSFVKVIYEHSSTYKNEELKDFNCNSVPLSLIASELYGHKKGAFTDAKKDKDGLLKKVDGGTLFLDEIGDMPVDVQVSFLTVLSNNEIWPVGSREPEKSKFRLISATNKDIYSLVRNEKFREDLFYRVVEIEVKIPPLRDRSKEELGFFIWHILFVLIDESKQKITDINLEKEALDLLLEKTWPGNNRQLISTMKVLSNMSKIKNNIVTITKNDVEKYYIECKSVSNSANFEDALYNCLGSKKCTLQELEKLFSYGVINGAIEREGSQKKAALFLGMTASNLSKRLNSLNKD